MRIAIALAVVLSGTAATWLTVETRRNRLVWDHFDVVKPGILYRSGQLNGDQLVDAVGRLGIRTVVNFQIPGEGVEATSGRSRSRSGSTSSTSPCRATASARRRNSARSSPPATTRVAVPS